MLPPPDAGSAPAPKKPKSNTVECFKKAKQESSGLFRIFDPIPNTPLTFAAKALVAGAAGAGRYVQCKRR